MLYRGDQSAFHPRAQWNAFRRGARQLRPPQFISKSWRLEQPEDFEENHDNENYSDYIEDASGHGGDLYQSESAVARNYLDWAVRTNAVDYAKFRSRSHDAVIRVYDDAGSVIETHEHARGNVVRFRSDQVVSGFTHVVAWAGPPTVGLHMGKVSPALIDITLAVCVLQWYLPLDTHFWPVSPVIWGHLLRCAVRIPDGTHSVFWATGSFEKNVDG